MINHFANPAEKTLPKTFIYQKESVAENWTIRHIGAGVGLLGGTCLLAAACFLTLIELVYGEKTHGVWLFLMVLPLWILGAHCFDRIERAEKAGKLEYCRKHLFGNGQWQ
jgi:hypothetical protein